MNQALNVFLCYAREDEGMKNELLKHLKGSVIRKKPRVFQVGKIVADEIWDGAVERKLQKADIVLLLLSPDFLKNRYMQKKEFAVVMERHSRGAALMIPVLLRPCDLHDTSLNQLQILPGPNKPVPLTKDRDLVYTEIANEIDRLISSFERKPKWLRLIEEEKKKCTGRLDLSDCQLASVPEQAKEMIWLTGLDLSSNQLTKIEGLEKFTILAKLSLNSNQITKIEGLHIFPTSIKALSLFKNPVENVDITVFGTTRDYNCLNDLKNFFAEDLTVTVPEVKLILTGNSDVGKTKFCTFLTTGKYDALRNSTHGLEVHSYKPDGKTKKHYGFEKDTQITVWDFGGQEYFHNTHQLFFNQNAVYVFLWEKETNKNQPVQTLVSRDGNGNDVYRVLEHFDADYWLSNIRHFAKDPNAAAIIVVQKKVDNYEKKGEPPEVLPYSRLKEYGCQGQHHISLSKPAEKDLDYWYDFEKLKHAVFYALKNFVSANKEPNIYNRVRKEIEKRKADNYWKAEDFISFIEGLKNASASAKAKTINNDLVIEHFNRQGKVLYPLDNGKVSLKDGSVIFTNPQWLSEKMYAILNEEVLQRNGFF